MIDLGVFDGWYVLHVLYEGWIWIEYAGMQPSEMPQGRIRKERERERERERSPQLLLSSFGLDSGIDPSDARESLGTRFWGGFFFGTVSYISYVR